MKKPLPTNLLISLATIIIFLLLAEVGMRLFWGMTPNVRRPFYQRSSNPFIRYELIPNHEDGRIKINSLGFRDDEYAVQKPDGVYRVVLLGDSEIFSIQLPQGQRLDNKLEVVLSQHDKSVRYEVINTGVEGYGTIQELEVLRAKGLRLDPDVVILNYCLNDPDEGEYHFSDNFLVRHSALYRYIWYRTRKAKLKRRLKELHLASEVAFFHYLHSGELWQNVENAILEMADLCAQRNIKLIVNIFPTSSLAVTTFEAGYPYRDIHEQIKSIRHDNIIFVDPIEAFNRRGMTPEAVSINYQYNESHKNPQALQVTAEVLYNALEENKIVPDASFHN